MSLHVLARHPDTPCTAIERVEVELDRDEGGAMRLKYRMIGDASRVVAVPPDAAVPRGVAACAGDPPTPRRTDELWRHTCCELFVRDAAGSGYREYNFAPSGDWAAYRFSGYRAGRVALDACPPRIALERSRAALVLTAVLTDQPFDALHPAQRVGIACVAETETETETETGTARALSYWALAHAPGRPDFHHARAFALTPAIGHTADLAQ